MERQKQWSETDTYENGGRQSAVCTTLYANRLLVLTSLVKSYLLVLLTRLDKVVETCQQGFNV